MSEAWTLLCPGQGAQAVGMGRAWAERSEAAAKIFKQADEQLGDRLGTPLSTLCAEGPAESLNRTDVTQPALFVASVASWHGVLAERGLTPGDAPIAAAAGLSLGEYTALHLAGAVSFEDGLELVTLRGRAMQDAAEAVPSGMVALIGADELQAEAVCQAARGEGVLVCANFNAPGQVVLSGDSAACERAVEEAGRAGLRATPLSVAGAFHSPLMQPAADRLEKALAETRIQAPRCPVLSNATGRPHESASGDTMTHEVRCGLVAQLTSPVRWTDCCRWLIEHAQGQWHELAPGRTLAGLMRRIDRAVKVETHDEPTDSAT